MLATRLRRMSSRRGSARPAVLVVAMVLLLLLVGAGGYILRQLPPPGATMPNAAAPTTAAAPAPAPAPAAANPAGVAPTAAQVANVSAMVQAGQDLGLLAQSAQVFWRINGAPAQSMAHFAESGAPATDPWGRPYMLRRTDDQRGWFFLSAGPDGVADTADDVVSATVTGPE